MAMSKMQRAREFVRRNRERAQAMVVQVRTDVETLGAASGAAYARGRFGDASMQVADIDIELLVGLPSKVLAYTSILGRAVSPDLHAIGNGVLAAYATQQMLAMGARHRSEDAAAQGVAGALGAGNVYNFNRRTAAVR